MADRETVIYDIERCICHVPDACKDCTKYSGIIAIRCMEELLADALSLLKAQEPRVMTKEEIIGWDGYIWFEFRGMRAMKTVLIDHGMVREPFRGDYPTKELSWGDCQETWRAWTSRPTDEQREAVKWE